MSREEAIKNMLINKIDLLMTETGIEVTNQQFQNSLNKYLSSSASLTEIEADIERQFNEKLAFYKHDQRHEEIIASYKAGVGPFENGQNCYLVSYNNGQKTIQAAKLTKVSEPGKGINKPVKVMINDDPEKTAFRKDSSQVTALYLDDLEVIMSQIAFLLDVEMAKTYRVYDESMKPIGALSENCCQKVTEKFYDFEELAKIVFAHTEKPEIKAWLQEYNNKYPLDKNHDISASSLPELYNVGIEFSLKVIAGLPQITPENEAELVQKFFDMKIFELFSNSVDSTFSNYGVVVDPTKTPFTYRFGALFDKAVIAGPDIEPSNVFLNNFIVNKGELYKTLVANYYPFIKNKSRMIINNKAVITDALNLVIRDFLTYGVGKEYQQTIANNIAMMEHELGTAKNNAPDSVDDQLTDATNTEIATSRASALQRGQGVKKAKGQSLSLNDGSMPGIILDDSGRINLKFITIMALLIIMIVYIFSRFIN